MTDQVTDRPWWKKKRYVIPAALILLSVIGSAMGGDEDTTTDVAATTAEERTATTEATTTTTRAPTTTTTEVEFVPSPQDFTLNVVTLEKSCYGSAGCNVTYRVEVAYTGAQPLDDDITYELTYELEGGDDAKIATIQIEGQEYEQTEDFIGTPSEDTVLVPVVTSLRER